MLCERLLSDAGLECPEHLRGRDVTGVVTDSRQVFKDCIFVCICGTLRDGHAYVRDAIEAGAAVIVAEKSRGVCEGGAAIIYVDNTRLIASLLYNAWYKSPASGLKIIGVTGTNGKTSTALMMLSIFEGAGYPCGFLGTVGYFSAGRRPIADAQMTTPDPETLYRCLAQMKSDGVEYVFMEVSSHALAQSRVAAIEFDTAVFTNLTEDHLDFHGDMKTYYKAKKILFSQCRRAVVNIDDPAGRVIFRALDGETVDKKSCSLERGDFCALLPKVRNMGGSEYALKTANGIHRVFLPLDGDFQIMNSLEAVAVAIMHGISIEVIRNSLLGMGVVPGRMEKLRLHSKQSFDLFIDYAHTPDALEKLLQSARAIKEDRGKIILVFGCGGERDRDKRRVMGQIASRFADMTVITSDNSRGEDPQSIIKEILQGIDKERPYAVIADRKEAIEYALCQYARPGDIVLLAGKGHENYSIDSAGKHCFDEKEIVKNALKKLYDN